MTAKLLTLVFDGHCGFCTRSVLWLKALDKHQRIAIHAFQTEGVLERHGLTPAQAKAAAWAFDKEGRRYRGAGAVNKALDVALGTRFFSICYRFPGIGDLQDQIYAWVARNRYRLRGVQPWCEADPTSCTVITG